MAQRHLGTGIMGQSSYARIAAMPVPVMKQKSNVQNKPVEPPHDHKQERHTRESAVQMPPNRPDSASIHLSMQKLGVEENGAESLGSEPNADSADSYEEDQSQLSGSSSNKPQSFDTKSLASVTTFAMDDKESIRPDDSASVRAVDDETPQPSLSRHSSFQHESEHSQRLPARVFPPTGPTGRRFPTLAHLPRFGNLPISPVLESADVQMPHPPIQVLSIDDPREPVAMPQTAPDDKLMDALVSAKDRLPLLQLEEKVLAFLAASSSSVLELPPQNSFTRLLTHKLADYYNLPHTVNEDNTSVRIFRNGSHYSPTSLAQLARSMPIGSATGPSTAAVKIMRREQLGRHASAGNSTAPSSSVPSKATSENGGDVPSDDCLTSPADSTPNREKSRLTREEREAQYKAARDRIFADFPESLASEADSTGEHSATMSRTSSSSGKKKNKRNKPRDDSFDSRSAFALTYAPVQTQHNNSYMDSSPANGYASNGFDQSMYGATPTQAYPGFDHMQFQQPQMPSMQQQQPQMYPADWQMMQNMQMQEYMMYQQHMQYQQSQSMSMMQAQGMPSPGHDWYVSNQFSANMYPPMQPFHQHPAQDSFQVQNNSYSQPMPRNFASDTSTQYNSNINQKSLFNPQTRSFVPNDGNGRKSRKKGSHHNARNNSISHTGTREESLKLKYGAPASLPKKPPPTEKRHNERKIAPDVIDTAKIAQQEA